MPGGLKKKSLRTELDLTPKQKMFVEIYVQDWGNITQAEALKRAGYVCTNEKDYGSVASRMLSRKHSPHIAKYFDKLFLGYPLNFVFKFQTDKRHLSTLILI